MTKPWVVRCSQKCHLCVGERRERNWCRGEDGHDGDHLCHDHAGVGAAAGLGKP
jgi:hypothetical protein